jgi:hypothetical protein
MSELFLGVMYIITVYLLLVHPVCFHSDGAAKVLDLGKIKFTEALPRITPQERLTMGNVLVEGSHVLKYDDVLIKICKQNNYSPCKYRPSS